MLADSVKHACCWCTNLTSSTSKDCICCLQTQFPAGKGGTASHPTNFRTLSKAFKHIIAYTWLLILPMHKCTVQCNTRQCFVRTGVQRFGKCVLQTRESGAYKGFDENEFTCRSGGKPAALKHIKVGVLLHSCSSYKWKEQSFVLQDERLVAGLTQQKQIHKPMHEELFCGNNGIAGNGSAGPRAVSYSFKAGGA
eukprot:scaffold313903_cov20-Tisochrysis_lutea.AAC.1